MPLEQPVRRHLPWRRLAAPAWAFLPVVGTLLLVGSCMRCIEADQQARREQQERARTAQEARRGSHRFCIASEGRGTQDYDRLPRIQPLSCWGARGLVSPEQIDLKWNSSLFGTDAKSYVHEGTLSLRSSDGGKQYSGTYRWAGMGEQAGGRISWFNCYGEKCIGVLESDPHRLIRINAFTWREDPGRYYRVSLSLIE